MLPQHEIIQRDFYEIIFCRIKGDFYHDAALVHVSRKGFLEFFMRKERGADLDIFLYSMRGIVRGGGARSSTANRLIRFFERPRIEPAVIVESLIEQAWTER